MSDENHLLVRVEWHQPDASWSAVLLREGRPWFLDGALVGMGDTPGEAVENLVELAKHLVIHGENFLIDWPLSLADREWLFRLLEPGDENDEMYGALRAAREGR